MEAIQKKQDLSEIIQQIKSGERVTADQFSHIFNLTKNIVRKAVIKKAYNITKYEREVMVQDIATKILAIGKLKHYNPVFSYDAFVYRTAVNSVIDNHRRTAKFKADISIEPETEYISVELVSGDDDPSELLISKERCSLLKQVIRQGLSRSERLILLSQVRGVSVQELADKLSISRNCLYLRIHRIKQKLKRHITIELKLTPADLY